MIPIYVQYYYIVWYIEQPNEWIHEHVILIVGSKFSNGKDAFQISDLALKPSRPLLVVLMTDQEVFYWLKEDLGDFWNF